MKKLLLLMVCAVMMTAANAANFSKSGNFAPKSLKLVNKTSIKNKLINPISAAMDKSMAMPKTTPSKSAFSKVAKTAASQSDFAGSWVDEYSDDMTDYCGEVFNVVTNDAFSTEVVNDTLWVVAEGALQGYADLAGYYDPETSTVTFPAQYCYEDEDYGQFAFGGLDDEYYLCDYVVNVTVDDNGHISMANDEDMWIILMTEGDYEGYTWTSGSGLAFNKCNYRYYGYECHIESSAWTDWADDSCDVYVEPIEDDIFIHGMFGTTINMSYDTESTYYLIPNKQPVTYGYLSSSKSYIPFYTYNCGVDDEGYLEPKMDEEFLPDEDFTLNAYVSTTDALVFGTPDDTSSSGVDWDYIYIAKFISATSGYFKGLHCAQVAVPFSSLPEGIETVNATTLSAKSNASFNLAGQQVGKNFKGIVIRDGKKVIM